jgi:competence protein ComEC
VPDRWVLALVGAAVAGAVAAAPVPLPAPLLATGLLGVVALARGRSLLVCLALAGLVSELGHRAEAGLAPPEPGPVRGEVVLVTDPQPSGPGLRADARLGGRRVLLRARGPAAEALTDRLAGEHVTIVGDLEPVAPVAWLRARHVAASVTVWRVEGWRPGSPVTQAANALRRTLEAGATSLSPSARTLFTGLVIGDDRAQLPEEADAFRATGLTHLTAVSGQNVALVLALVSPVLARLRLWPRLLVTLLVILVFGLVTRFEPSVLRASALAGIAAVAVTVGRPLDRLRALGLAVAGLLVVDPLLVHAVGFQLSVAATAGILVGTRPLAAVLPGPRPLREALALATAAQIGVSPVLLATFGPVPLASLPANVLAVPAKGLVMMWGLTAGLVAGVVGGQVAEVLHLPTGVLVGWISLVAERTAALPVGSLGVGATVAATAGLVAAVALRGRRSALARLGAGLAVLVLVATVGGANQAPALRHVPEHGVVVWRAGGGVVVELSGRGRLPAPGAARVLEGVRATGVRHVDLVVVGDARVDRAAVAALLRRYGTPAVVGPGGLPAGLGATTVPPPGTALAVRGLDVDLVTAGGRLVVDARPRSPRGDRRGGG